MEFSCKIFLDESLEVTEVWCVGLEFLSECDPTRNVVNFVKLNKFEDVYGNVVHVCFTDGKCTDDENVSKGYSLEKNIT